MRGAQCIAMAAPGEAFGTLVSTRHCDQDGRDASPRRAAPPQPGHPNDPIRHVKTLPVVGGGGAATSSLMDSLANTHA